MVKLPISCKGARTAPAICHLPLAIGSTEFWDVYPEALPKAMTFPELEK